MSRYYEPDPPYCAKCKVGFTKAECDACFNFHEKLQRERELEVKRCAVDEYGYPLYDFDDDEEEEEDEEEWE
ncbi:MAG: hypothetical protein J6T10_27795 [Methanobrevibacter sp.]|nr:hypothetical protein [Methanobrevibacter sp.]